MHVSAKLNMASLSLLDKHVEQLLLHLLSSNYWNERINCSVYKKISAI